VNPPEPRSPRLPAGHVPVGRFILEIGAPAGTSILDAEDEGDNNLRPLQGALKEDKAEAPEPGTRGIADAATEVVDEASEMTSKLEHAVGLLNQVAEGRLDPKALSGEVPMLLDALERLDRDRRWSEALRLARALSGLLALLMRWVELVRSLQTALRVAEKLGDHRAVGWAVHELGTLHLGAERASAAERRLGQAREIRQRVGDQDGLAMTQHNLQALCRLTNRLMREHRLVERNTVFQRLRYSPALIAALAVVLVAGGAAGYAVIDGDGDPGQERAGEPGTGKPGSGEPGAGEPDAGEPGTGEPDAGEPGTGEPIGGEPIDGEPPDGQVPDGGVRPERPELQGPSDAQQGEPQPEPVD
jgi:hypothetical protein